MPATHTRWSGAQPLSPAYPSQVSKGLNPSAGQALSHSPQPTQVRQVERGAEPISWSGAQPLSPAYPSQVPKGAEPIS